MLDSKINAKSFFHEDELSAIIVSLKIRCIICLCGDPADLKYPEFL